MDAQHQLTTAEIVANQSQDYVDEKELEYLQTIQHLAAEGGRRHRRLARSPRSPRSPLVQHRMDPNRVLTTQFDERIVHVKDEQERVQKKTFVNWINSCLVQPVERGRILRRPHFLSNVNTALQFLERKRVKLVNINASDVVDGRPPVVLGLIWTIILFFQIEEKTRSLGEQMYHLQAGSSSSLESAGSPHEMESSWKQSPTRRRMVPSLARDLRSGARKALLQWVKAVISTKYSVVVSDFGPSWRDGYAFLALISSIRLGLVDWNSLRFLTNRDRLEMAFDLAEKHLGIARLLDPEDVDVPQPDERSIMTYVAQFLHKYPELGTRIKAEQPSMAEIERTETEELRSWVLRVLTVVDDANQQNSFDYTQYFNIRNEMNEKEEIYDRIRARFESKVSVYLTENMWRELETLWTRLQNGLYEWQRRLDANLPSPFNNITDWLHKAEKLLSSEIVPPTLVESDLEFVAAKLYDHKEFFQHLPAVQREFETARNSSVAKNIRAEHLQEIEERLERVFLLSERRRLCLLFEQECLNSLTVINKTKRKIQTWTSKYGSLQEVENLAAEFREYVDVNHVILEFDRAYDQMQCAADAYKAKVMHEPKAVENVNQLLKDVKEQWRSVTVELQCMNTMLQQLISSWKYFLTNYDRFEQWLTSAERAAKGSEGERIEFFHDLNVWKERYESFHESGNFLQTACVERISQEISNKMLNIDQRWELLLMKVQDYLVAGELMKHKHEYRTGMSKLQDWVSKAEKILTDAKLSCSVEVLQSLLDQLQHLQQQGDDIQNLFKNVSKKAQCLIQEVSREEVDKMMTDLKKVKEAIVRVRATIPSRIYLYQQLLAQQEALEKGFAELSRWLDEGDVLLASHSLTDSPEHIRKQLDKHRNFFARTLYYRSMLESKNKIHESIVSSMTGDAHAMDTGTTLLQLTQLNRRFQTQVSLSRQWEQHLEQVLRSWLVFTETQKTLDEWLAEATRLLEERTTRSESVMRQYESFFSQNTQHLVQNLKDASNDLLACLSTSQHAKVEDIVAHYERRWKEIVDKVPLHLLKLEFRLNETTFQQLFREMEKELISQETEFNQNENVEYLVRKHEETFEKTESLSRLIECVNKMKTISESHVETSDKAEMTSKVRHFQQQMKDLESRICDLQTQLRQIPQQWTEYRRKFEALERWMDDVEQSVNKLSQEAQTMEEFEDLRVKFQIGKIRKICDEVDSRRGEMKWLVQMLDSLILRATDEDAVAEQRKLEALIARYKSLLPNIEITTVRVDTITKCFIYKEEVEQVVTWLKEKQKVSAQDERPHSLTKLDQLIAQQQKILQQLEEQRSKIISTVQHGRELQKESSAPQFVSSHVDKLEKEWKEIYTQTTSKLKLLRGTKETWHEYDEQKNELQRLLEQADSELVKLSGSHDFPTLRKELKAKQELSSQLQETSGAMLQKLHSMKKSLAAVLTPDQRSLMEREAAFIEERITTIITTVKTRIIQMEDTLTKWNNLNAKMDEYNHWINSSNQTLDAAIKSVAPEEKASKIQILKDEIDKRTALLYRLKNEAQHLITNDPNSDQSRNLRAQIADMEREMEILQGRLASGVKMAYEEAERWRQYQTARQEFEPWLAKAEGRVCKGHPRPKNLAEAKQQLHQSQQFQKDCESRKGQLAKMNSEVDRNDSSQISELNLMDARWQSVVESATQWVLEETTLVSNWIEIEETVTEMQKWLHHWLNKFDEQPVEVDSPNIDTLMRKLEETKSLREEALKNQIKLIALTQVCERMCLHVSEEAGVEIKSNVTRSKREVARLLERITERQQTLSELVNRRQEFNSRLSHVRENVARLERQLNSLNRVDADRVEEAVGSLKDIKQEISDLQPKFDSIYEEIKTLNRKCSSEEMSELNEEFSSLTDRFQLLEEKVDLKELLFQRWLEFDSWCTDIVERVQLHEQRLESKPAPDQLERVAAEVESLTLSPHTTEKMAAEIEDLMRRSQTVIVERNTGESTHPKRKLAAICMSISAVQTSIQNKRQHLQKMNAQEEAFAAAHSKLLQFLTNSKKRIDEETMNETNVDELERLLLETKRIMDEMNAKQAERDELHEKGREILRINVAHFNATQTALAQIDTVWDQLSLALVDRHTQLQTALALWRNCRDVKKDIESTQQHAKRIAWPMERAPSDVSQVDLLLSKAKNVSVAYQKQKPLVEQYQKKMTQLIQQLREVPGFDAKVLENEMVLTCQQWQEALNKVLAHVQNLESQKVVWSHIEEDKGRVETWLAGTCNVLQETGGKAKENVAKYKTELPVYEKMHSALLSKMASLESLNEGSDVSVLDAIRSALKSQFSRVEKVASTVETNAGLLSQEEANVSAELQGCHAWLNATREQVATLDNLSGDEEQLVQQLQQIKKLGKILEQQQHTIMQIEIKIRNLKATFEGYESNHLDKEHVAILKKCEQLEAQIAKTRNGLQTALEKKLRTRIQELSRFLAATQEKVEWTNPQFATDINNMRANQQSLKEIEENLKTGEEMQENLKDAIGLAEGELDDEKLREIEKTQARLLQEWEKVKISVAKTKQKQTTVLNIWQKRNELRDGLARWLQETETKIRPYLSATIETQMRETADQLRGSITEIENQSAQFAQLFDLSKEINLACPETREMANASQLESNRLVVLSSAKNHLERLQQYLTYRDNFDAAVGKFQSWMTAAEGELRSRSNISPTGEKPLVGFKIKLNRLKELENSKEEGRELLGSVFKSGDNLLATISIEGREKIRSELKSLRSQWENYWDEINVLVKKVEIAMMQWDSFDDSCRHMESWLQEVENRIGETVQLMPTLHDKKLALQNYKLIAQDINSHKILVERLEGKVEEFEELNVTVNQMQLKQKELFSTAMERITLCEQYVAEHESYQLNVDKFRDWFSNLQTDCCNIQQQDASSIETQSGSFEAIAKQQENGAQLLSDLKQQLDLVVTHTRHDGHPALVQEFDSLKNEWDSFKIELKAAKERFSSLQLERDQCANAIAAALSWINSHEIQVKEISLKPDLESKRLQLEKLKQLCKGVVEKQVEVSSIVQRAKTMEGDSQLVLEAAQLNLRYQTLCNIVKDLVAKWEVHVADHSTYDELFGTCLEKLDYFEDRLSQYGQLAGDLNELDKRKTQIEELAEEQIDLSSLLEKVVDLGEQLYPFTAPDGRELIRQQSRTLREKWDRCIEMLNKNSRSLNQCLKEFENFTVSQEQLTQWLKEIEKSLEQHTELKGSLQEKQAQLQNHKIVHQEICSHRQLVEKLCDRARSLGEQTGDKNLQVYIRSIKKLYDVITDKSKQLLSKLEQCVTDHQQFLNECREFRNWIEKHQQQLETDTTGDKNKIIKKLEVVQLVIEANIKAEAFQEHLSAIAARVSAGSSAQGVENTTEELEKLEEMWELCSNSAKESRNALEDVKQKWIAYETESNQLNQWCEKIEMHLRDVQLQSMFAEKQRQLAALQALRERIIAHEKDINLFSDRAHSLLHLSQVESIKGHVIALNARFQALLTNSKDQICKWQSMVDDHKTFEQKFTETSDWLTALNAELNLLDQIEDVEEKTKKLQFLTMERERGTAKLNLVINLGERLYADTASTGREQIRHELRGLRELWEQFNFGVENYQKQMESDSQQRLQHNEGLQQILNWLDVVEKSLHSEQRTWGTFQEAKNKLVRYKSLQQDVAAHKRIVDSICEKSQNITNPVTKEGTISMKKRYDNLAATITNLVRKLDVTIDNLHRFSELQQGQAEWQKNVWDELIVFTDYTDNKQAMMTRLEKMKDLDNKMCEGEANLKAIAKQAEQLFVDLPQRSREILEREQQTMRLDFEKLSSTIKGNIDSLDVRIHQWTQYEEQVEKILRWLTETETVLKEFSPKTTLEEKEEQMQKYQGLLALVEAKSRSLQDFYNAAEILEQNIQGDILQVQKKTDSMSDSCAELMQVSSETRLKAGTQQVTSRYQSLLFTSKEVVKKCEQHVHDHQKFAEKYNDCFVWLRKAQEKYLSCSETSLTDKSSANSKLTIIKSLLKEQVDAMGRLSMVNELGEGLYTFTSPEGQQIIRHQLEELHSDYEMFFDNLSNAEHKLRTSLSTWSGFEEEIAAIKDWIQLMMAQLGERIEYHKTLDDKKTQLQAYRVILHDIVAHQNVISDLKQKTNALPDKEDNVEERLNKIWNVHQELLQRAQSFVETYEQLVGVHQQYAEAIEDMKKWLTSNRATVNSLGDTNQDRTTLLSNLERLKGLLSNFTDEEQNLTKVKDLSSKVLAGSSEEGQQTIEKEIYAVQQEWHSLIATTKNLIANLEKLVGAWNDYEKSLEETSNWLREMDSNLHGVDLKATVKEKQEQLNFLKNLQGEIRAKELEMDNVLEKAHQLYTTSLHRGSTISELGVRYQQTISRMKDLIVKWQGYVTSHQEFENELENCKTWLSEIGKRLAECSDLSATSHEDLESKLASVQNLLLYKEEGFLKVQSLIERAQNILVNTATAGHEAINEAVMKVQQEWSNLASKTAETKVTLEDIIHKWAGFLEHIQQLLRDVDYLEAGVKEVSEFQATIPEKRAQLERIKGLSEKVSRERLDVEALKTKADELSASGKQEHAAAQALDTLARFTAIDENLKVLSMQCEQHYKDHCDYKSACDDFVTWINNIQERLPLVTQSLTNRVALESAVASLEQYEGKRVQGQLKLDQIFQMGQNVLTTTSAGGQEAIKVEMKSLEKEFHDIFQEITQQKKQLRRTLDQWHTYKDEYDRISEWLQSVEKELKDHKMCLRSSLDEKKASLDRCTILLNELMKEEKTMDNLNTMAQALLTSHLDAYVNNQQRLINSRYQVLVNLAKDVLKKVEQNFECHRNYKENSSKTRSWIENAREVVKSCSDTSGTRDSMQSQLTRIQDLLAKQDEGQMLTNNTVSWGEKTIRSSRSDSRDAMKNEIQTTKTDWDRLVKKMSNAKVTLETSLLQWTDYSSSYKHLNEWLAERERKLQEVIDGKAQEVDKGFSERKIALRKTNSLVQDIVSFEPMIESVNYKAEELMQKNPTSQVMTDATEIATKYQDLTKHARQVLEQQKHVVEMHQAFVDACNDFNQWMRLARESLNKCLEAVGDKDTLLAKNNHLKLLLLEEAKGSGKLAAAVALGRSALELCQQQEQDVINEEIQSLQDEFARYETTLGDARTTLECALVKWSEYEELYKHCYDWLIKKEGEVQNYMKLQTDLEGKRTQLEVFQALLQTIFDWQGELDKLNAKAHILLETCSDSRISNAITQITSKYNALLSLAKEVMRRLEQYFQEHQQQQCIFTECVEWIDKTRERLEECTKLTDNADDLNNKLQTLKNLKSAMEQGQHKLRYVLELKEKVILNTDAAGAAKIQENSINLQQEFEKLMADIAKARQLLVNKISRVEDFRKTLRLFSTWLAETEEKMKNESKESSDLWSEWKMMLERFGAMERDVAAHQEAADRLRDKRDKDDEEIGDLLARYDKIVVEVKEKVEELQRRVKEMDEFNAAKQEANEWIGKSQIQVQEDCSGESKLAIENKCKKHEDIMDKEDEGRRLVEKMSSLARVLMTEMGDEGRVKVQNDIEQIEDEWEHLKHTCRAVKQNLEHCLNCWTEFESTYNQQTEWIDQMKRRVDNESASKVQNDLDKFKSFLDEAEGQKEEMSKLSEIGEMLAELSSSSSVRDQTVQLLSSYSNLMSYLQSWLNKVEKSVGDYNNYLRAKEEFNAWMQQCVDKLTSNSDVVGSEGILKTRLENLKDVSCRISESQQMLHTVSEAGARALNTIPVAEQEELRKEITGLHRGWDAFALQLSQSVSRLQAALARLGDFNEDRSKIEQWLKDIETRLSKPPCLLGNAIEMKTQIERYKHMLSEIEAKEKDVVNVQNEAQELQTKTGDENFVVAAKILHKRHQLVSEKCNDIISHLANDLQEFQDYHNGLQETEKWMLHTSFQLMANNSLYVNSLAQTQELISQHEVMLAEVRCYQSTIDDLRAKGNGLIDRYQDVANNVCTEIQQQLTNVQESYDALLKTANQILKRLQDSCQKFREYEDTLDMINNNLNSIEADFAKVTHLSLEEARNHQNSIRNVCNKLNVEKQRLQVAIQCCEDATASLSRPSSPEGAIPALISEKETSVRLRLEDMIDQADNAQTNISRIVNEWEELERCREELSKWISEQDAALVVHKAKPSRLRNEVAQSEINEIQYLKSQLEEKRQAQEDIEQRQQQLAPDYDDSSLQERLDQLESQVTTLLNLRLKTEIDIDEYRQLISNHNIWCEQTAKQLEIVDRGTGLDSVRKAESLKELLEDIDNQKSVLEELKNKANDILPELGGMDAQQVEEQIKNAEKKCFELEKRVKRKIQVIELIREAADNISKDIFTTQEWINETMKSLRENEGVAFRATDAESRIQDVNSIKRDVENKQLVIETISRQIDAMGTDLDGYEKDHLFHALDTLKEKATKLQTLLKEKLDELAEALGRRQQFERNLSSALQWLQEKQFASSSEEKAFLQSTTFERIFDTYKRYENEVERFEFTKIEPLRQDADCLRQELPGKEQPEFESAMNDLETTLLNVKTSLQERLAKLSDGLAKRVKYEALFAKCKQWTSQAEVSLSSEVRPTSAVNIIEEQLAKYRALLEEADVVDEEMSQLDRLTDDIKSEVTESNQFALQGQTDNLRDKFHSVKNLVREKVKALELMVDSRQQQDKELDDCLARLSQLQMQLKNLNRPLSHSVKDAHDALEAFVGKEANSLQERVDGLQKQSSLQTSELQSLNNQLTDLIHQVEIQIGKFKHSVILRQQFHALIADIDGAIEENGRVVQSIEDSDDSVADKIRRYHELIGKLNDCEANLVTASDKGQQIGAEGSALDHNFIMERLQGLKMDLNELKRTVEKNKSEHEGLAAVFNRMRMELEDILDKLHACEASVKCQPLLTLDTSSNLSQEMENLLAKLRSVEDKLSSDYDSDVLPVTVHEQSSRAKALAQTLPTALREQEKYLNAALESRNEYHNCQERLAAWIELAKVKLQTTHDGIDYENINNDLKEHKVKKQN
uniref:Calponin-homology (CH) domain-containing protein n=1 Tax=Strigamia maritima TaxID=126957 RepID=T1JGP1_STRMM